jgi:hypothetical protein
VALIAVGLLPVSLGVAILRHRLFGIDVVIRRTVTYGSLTAVQLLVYGSCVVVLESVIQGLTGRQSELAIVGSTVVIATLLQPVGRRIQAGVDRRFYRSRFDAALTLQAFSTRLRQELDLDALGEELQAVVRDTMQPSVVSFWLKQKPAMPRVAPSSSRWSARRCSRSVCRYGSAHPPNGGTADASARYHGRLRTRGTGRCRNDPGTLAE